MTFEEAIKWVDSTRESKTGKKLTIPEKEILKAVLLSCIHMVNHVDAIKTFQQSLVK